MSGRFSLGATILRFALAFFLIVTGIWGIMGSDSLFPGITSLFAGSLRNIVVILISVVAVIAGTLLLIEIFTANFPIVDTILLVFTILWVIQLVLFIIGGIGTAFSNSSSLLKFLHSLSFNLLVLAALIISQRRFN